MSLFRPNVEQISGYVPGEQPRETGWIKLNTNENPYPPSPKVVEAIESVAKGRLNIYPDPLATQFRKQAAKLFDVDPDWILPANGSDENLTIIMRSFVDPGELVSFPYPSYILYETLADLQGARHTRLPLNADWSWNREVAGPIVEQTKLIFVPNPNSPGGNLWKNDELLEFVPPAGVFVLDEAYGDFADSPHHGEILQTNPGRQIIITRSLSKSYSLAGIRFGFAVAHPELIEGMRKVKDSYNCNTLSLAAATAAMEDQEWMLKNREKIQASRKFLTVELRAMGFDVVDSQANFVWVTHPGGGHNKIYEELKQRKILIRYMRFPDVACVKSGELDGLRITVGTNSEIEQFLQAIQKIV